MSKKKFIMTSALSVLTLIMAVGSNNNLSIVRSTDENNIWYHYLEVEPTEDRHGSVEFWASKSNNCQTYQLSEPEVPQEQIIDRDDFGANLYFDDMDLFDERYVAPTSYGEVDGRDREGVFSDYGLLFNSRLTIKSTQFVNGNIAKQQIIAFQFGKMSVYDSSTGLTKYASHEYNSDDYYANIWTPINDGSEYNYETRLIGESLYSYVSTYGIFRSFNIDDFDFSSIEHIYKLNKAQVAIESSGETQLYCTDCYFGYKNGQIDEIEFTLSDGVNPIKTIRDQYSLNSPTIVPPDIPE